MNGKKILITGSTGLLGSSLVDSLNFKNIVGFSSDELDILDTKILNDKLNSKNPDVIIHTAAYTFFPGARCCMCCQGDDWRRKTL